MNIYEYNASDTKIKLYFKQLLTALGPLTGLIAAGMSNGYSAILLPQLKISSNDSQSLSESADVDHFGTLTTDQESWIAAAAVLPIASGCWTGGFMAERFGRRTSLRMVYPIFCIGWLSIGLANSVQTLIASRLLIGYCTGIHASIFPIYVSETSDPLLRGVLLGAVGLTLSIGTLACHAMGTWLNWRTTAYICAVLPIISWIASFFSQESPMWLLGKGKIEEAKRSWIFLRGERSLEEFSLLETTRLMEISEKRTRKRSILRSFMKPWSSRYFLKPFGIVCLYFFVTQFAGANVMLFYCVEMLEEISGQAHAYLITLIIDAIRLTFGIIMCVLLKTCRRRIMTFISGFGVAVTLLSLSACLTFNIGRPWIPVILLVTYVALLPLGLTPIPWLLCGELFPRKFRGLGSGLTSGFNFMCFFVVIKTMPAMIELIKPEGTFAIYGSVALIGTSALYFILPETKNKTLQEIQISFNKKSHKPQIQDMEVPFHEYDESEKNKKWNKEIQNDE